MNPSLTGFQDQFVAALYGHESAEMKALAQHPGFAVYRNTVLKGSTDALLANFPTLERLVGRDWLRSAATIHARTSPPVDARLLYYGEDFARFLDGFEPARELPYLGDVARLDWLWTQVHAAEDEPALELSALACLSPLQLVSARLRPRAAARWHWAPDCPAYTLWRLNREQRDMPESLDWRSEGALLTRRNGQVHWQAASAGDCAFLEACAAHLPIDLAANLALEVEPTLNLEPLIIRLVCAEAFTAVEP